VPILGAYFGVIVCALGMWSSVSAPAVGFFRYLAGFSVGAGVPAALTIVSEIAPARSRGQLLSACYVALAVGALYADLGLYIFLPDLKSGDWRSLCLWSGLPAVLALPFGWKQLEDTPSFYAAKGDLESLSRVLTKMSQHNGRPEVVWRPPPQPPPPGGPALLDEPVAEAPDSSEEDGNPILSLASVVAQCGLPLACCASLDFAYNFVGFGVGYFFPVALSELTDSSALPPVAELVLSNLVTFPALFLAYTALSSEVGNKPILFTAGIALIASTACLAVGSPGSALMLLGIVALKLSQPAFSQTTNTLKGEMFPLRVRVTALSISGTVGRMGALIAPALIEKTRGGPGSEGEFNIFFGTLITVVAFAISFGLAGLPETNGKKLPE